MSTIKLLHIVQTLGTGGLENGVVNLANGHDRSKFEVTILCLRGAGALTDRLAKDVTVIAPNEGDESILSAIKLILRTVREQEYNIVHTHGWATMLPAYLVSLIGPIDILINGEHGTYYADTFRRRVLQRFLFNRMHLNLSVSGVLAKTLSNEFDVNESKFHVILNGVDVERFAENKSQRDRLRSEWGVSDQATLYGSVGRLVPVKNYPCLLRAFAKLQPNDNAKLVLVGDGPQRDELLHIATELAIQDAVIFAGRREDIPDVLNAIDVFVLPSFSEGLSNTLLEAMATGKLVIASKVGGNPELVEHGKTGLLFESDDEKQLMLCLVDAKENFSTNVLGNNARQFIRTSLSIQTMIENYERVYLDCMALRLKKVD